MPNAGPDLSSPTALARRRARPRPKLHHESKHAWANAPVLVPVRKPSTTGHSALSCAATARVRQRFDCLLAKFCQT